MRSSVSEPSMREVTNELVWLARRLGDEISRSQKRLTPAGFPVGDQFLPILALAQGLPKPRDENPSNRSIGIKVSDRAQMQAANALVKAGIAFFHETPEDLATRDHVLLAATQDSMWLFQQVERLSPRRAEHRLQSAVNLIPTVGSLVPYAPQPIDSDQQVAQRIVELAHGFGWIIANNRLNSRRIDPTELADIKAMNAMELAGLVKLDVDSVREPQGLRYVAEPHAVETFLTVAAQDFEGAQATMGEAIALIPQATEQVTNLEPSGLPAGGWVLA